MTNIIIQGVLLGGYYALIACGLSFMFSVMKVINLAHGSIAILAAYLLWFLAEQYGVNPFFGLAIVLPVLAILGWLLQRLILERSAKGGELLPILTTFGLSIVIDNLLFQQFGADTRSLAPYIGDLSWSSWQLGESVYVGKLSVLIFAVAVGLLGGLETFLRFTHLGRSIRATAMDPDTAGLVGINARRVSAVATSISLVTVGIAGAFLAMRGTFNAYSGSAQLLFAFEVVIIGGTTSLWRTLVGGLALALAQQFGASIHPQGFLIAGHAMFFLVLAVRFASAQGDVRARVSAMIPRRSNKMEIGK